MIYVCLLLYRGRIDAVDVCSGRTLCASCAVARTAWQSVDERDNDDDDDDDDDSDDSDDEIGDCDDGRARDDAFAFARRGANRSRRVWCDVAPVVCCVAKNLYR